METKFESDRTSPLHSELVSLNPRWCVVEGAAVPYSIGSEEEERKQTARLALADASAYGQVGVRGGDLGALLDCCGVPNPPGLYSWAAGPKSSVVVRTGTREVFVEDRGTGGILKELLACGREFGSSVSVIPREYACMILRGENAPAVMAET